MEDGKIVPECDREELRANSASPTTVSQVVPDLSDSLQTLVFYGSAHTYSGTNQGRWKPLRVQSLGSRLPHPLCPCRSGAGGDGQ